MINGPALDLSQDLFSRRETAIFSKYLPLPAPVLFCVKINYRNSTNCRGWSSAIKVKEQSLAGPCFGVELDYLWMADDVLLSHSPYPYCPNADLLCLTL